MESSSILPLEKNEEEEEESNFLFVEDSLEMKQINIIYMEGNKKLSPENSTIICFSIKILKKKNDFSLTCFY